MRRSAHVRVFLLAVVAACALGGCSSDMVAIGDMMRAVVQRDPAGEPRLNPKLQYLRVTLDGRTAFVALGEIDQHPLGPIEVYFSAGREVLRFQNGRVVGAVGTTTEWRRVLVPELPAWSALAEAGKPVQWERVRDVMPGYRHGVRDRLVLRAVPPPSRSALREVDPNSLTWFEERSEREGIAGLGALPGSSIDAPLPPARYAVDIRAGAGSVVYGEQCLSADFCFSWQRWAVK